jgi:hypothetical protein
MIEAHISPIIFYRHDPLELTPYFETNYHLAYIDKVGDND